MNRRGLFFRGLFAGYLAAGANFAFTILSVPLALHYLTKEEFGLWALVLQVGGYLMLLDLGMSPAVSRFLADHKDSMNEGQYGTILRTANWFFWGQAFLVVLLAVVFAWALPTWLDISPELVPALQRLVVGQAMVLGLGLLFRPLSLPLWAHQRVDITHLAASANLMAALVAMAVSFHLGLGVDSYLVGSLFGALWTWLIPWIACRKLGLYPARSRSASFQRDVFFKMLSFGRDVVLMQMGGLLCQGSQIIVVTKTLGLEAAAVFSVVTKTLTMGQQLLGRVLESAAPGLTEMYVRGERQRFLDRFYKMTGLSTIMATITGVAIMASNSTWVALWTRDAVTWDHGGDLILGALLIATVTSRCFQGAFGITAELFKVRYFSLIEGGLFIFFALIFGPPWGLKGILFVSLLSQMFVTLLGSGLQVRASLPPPSFWGQLPLWTVATYLACSLANVLWARTDQTPLMTFCWAGGLSLLALILLWFGCRGFRLPRSQDSPYGE